VRRDQFTATNDQLVAQDVQQIPGGLGIVGLTAATKQLKQLRLVSVDGGRGCVKPTGRSIASGAYPLSRSLYVYVNLDRAAANPTVQAFVTLLVSQSSLARVAAVGAVPLTQKAQAHTAARWSAR
jgi:phosphate transport system substrate-binding protein